MNPEPRGDGPDLRAAVPDSGAIPDAAVTVFGDRLPSMVAYAHLLQTVGVERGVIGPREAPRLWQRHLLNCAGLAELLPHNASVLDLGAGAGLPGIVLAVSRPDLEVVLLEPLLRRAVFLQEVVDNLGLPQVRVFRSRAEDAAGTLQVDVVTARAVAPLERLVGWAMPLVRPGGCLLAQKGERAEQEVAAAQAAVARSGGTRVRVETVGEEQLCTFGRVVVVVRAPPSDAGGGSAERVPRRGSSPSRRRDPWARISTTQQLPRTTEDQAWQPDPGMPSACRATRPPGATFAGAPTPSPAVVTTAHQPARAVA